MARKNPLGKLKDLTVDTLKSPKEAAGKAVGQAREAASVGKLLAGQATKSATSLTAGAVSKLVQGRKLTIPPISTTEPAATQAATPPARPTPVNVTEELGLDKAPVDTKPATRSGSAIDAAADPDHVEVTPADIAKAVAKKAPPRKPAATKPATKKAPASKSAPGAKLPPRKKAPESESATSAGGTDKG